jgi:hypothetical protein
MTASTPASASPAAPASSSGVGPSPSVLGQGPVIAIPGLGLSLRLPSGWVGLDSTVPPSLLGSTTAGHADLAESLTRLGSGELGFVAFDPASTSEPTPRITIATTGDAIPTIPLLESLAWHTADQLARTASISDLEVTPATLAAGPAVELRYRVQPAASGPVLAVDSWFISAGGHTVLLTFTGPGAESDAWRPKVRAIADSLSGG